MYKKSLTVFYAIILITSSVYALSGNKGKTWIKVKQLTNNSDYNHAYVRKPVNVHPGFYGFWADGHGRQQFASRLNYSDKKGNVIRLPQTISEFPEH